MEVPSGVTIIFDGGSFDGDLPPLCELKNAPVVVGFGENVALTFQQGATLAAGSDLELDGGSVAITTATIAGALKIYDGALTITTSLTVSGSLQTTGSSAISAPTLVKSGSGSIRLVCGAATGTTWNVARLDAYSADVATLTTSGNVDVDADAEGTTWNVGGRLAVGGDCDVDALTVAQTATIQEDAYGTNWNVGALTVLGDCDVETLVATGVVSVTGAAEGTNWTTGALYASSLDVPTLTLNGSSNVDLSEVDDLTLGANAVLTLRVPTTLETLTASPGATISFNQKFLAVKETATLSNPLNLSNAGYFALPTGSDETALAPAQGSDVRVCAYGAGLTSVSAALAANQTDIVVTPTRTDSTKTVLVERKVGGVWELIAAKASGAVTTSAVGRITEVRVFDGIAFFSASVLGNDPRLWLVYVNAAATQTCKAWNVTTDYAIQPNWTITSDYALQPTWNITTDYVMASEYNYAGESILLFARLEYSGGSSLVTALGVSSVKYTCYKRTFAWGKETRTAVTGHSNVSIPTNSILSSPVTNDSRWTKDATGYNFRYEPDTTTNQIFPEPGDYIIVITFTPTSGNPAPVCFEITVN